MYKIPHGNIMATGYYRTTIPDRCICGTVGQGLNGLSDVTTLRWSSRPATYAKQHDGRSAVQRLYLRRYHTLLPRITKGGMLSSPCYCCNVLLCYSSRSYTCVNGDVATEGPTDSAEFECLLTSSLPLLHSVHASHITLARWVSYPALPFCSRNACCLRRRISIGARKVSAGDPLSMRLRPNDDPEAQYNIH